MGENRLCRSPEEFPVAGKKENAEDPVAGRTVLATAVDANCSTRRRLQRASEVSSSMDRRNSALGFLIWVA